MHIDHLAIAVRNLEQAADRLCLLFGYVRDTRSVTNTRQDVNVLDEDKVLQRAGVGHDDHSGGRSRTWRGVRSVSR